MRYILGNSFKVTSTPLTGSIKNKFKPGNWYTINNIVRIGEEFKYFFKDPDNNIFDLIFKSCSEADRMIDFIIHGKILEYKDFYSTERSD